MDQSFSLTEEERLLRAFRRAREAALKKKADDASTGAGNNNTAEASVTAAFARSFVLLMGVYFKRPSRLFRPSRVDTLGALRRIAVSTGQTLSPSFIRALVKHKGPKAVFRSIIPPLIINTALGTLLFTSHSYFCYLLSRLDFFAPNEPQDGGPQEQPSSTGSGLTSLLDDWDALTKRGETLTSYGDHLAAHDGGNGCADHHHDQDGKPPTWMSFGAEDQISFMESIHRLPHPTLMNALAGAGAGAIQGVAFAPIENAVKLLQRGITSWTEAFSRVFGFNNHHTTTSTTTRFHPIKDLKIPKNRQQVKQFLGLGEGFVKAWNGVRHVMVRDALGYALFFSTFDVSRRVGLGVKAWLTPENPALVPLVAAYTTTAAATTTPRGADSRRSVPNDSRTHASPGDGQDHPIEDLLGLHPKAPTRARLAQAGVLVLGGISASFLAEFITRPARKVEDLAKLAANRAAPSTLEFTTLNPPSHHSGQTRPTTTTTPTPTTTTTTTAATSNGKVWPLVKATWKREGIHGFFRDPATLHTPLQASSSSPSGATRLTMLDKVKTTATRFGWRLVGVGPWGIGFVIFAYLGGEV